MPSAPEDDLVRLRAALRPASAGARTDSAVLAPVVGGDDGALLLFTLRPLHLASHPGQISFPGGRLEATDPDPLTAALREAREEIGLDPGAVDVLGHLVDYTTFRGDTVSAFVGRVGLPALPPRLPATGEVEAILFVPLAELRAAPRGPLPPRGPAPLGPGTLVHVVGYEARRMAAAAGPERLIHYWRLSDGSTLWGITGDIVALLLGRAYAWSPPSAPRPISRRDEVPP